MSKICIFVVTDICQECKASIENDILKFISEYNLGAFFDQDDNEPFLSFYENCFTISIADSGRYNNCEFLMLPEGWSVAGKMPVFSFRKRMMILQEIASLIVNKICRVELFVGDSGNDYDDFMQFECNFMNVAKTLLNNYEAENGWSNNLHISIR